MPKLPPRHNEAARRTSANAQSKQRQGRRLYTTSSKRWRADREIQLSKQPLCEHCLIYGRTTPANEVDHINGRADREQDNTPDNYQSLCKRCHSTKTKAELDAKNRGVMHYVKVYLVSGSAGAGKTTYANNHKHYKDLVIDLDAIYSALGASPYDKPDHLTSYVFATKNAVIARIGEQQDIRAAWIIQSHVTSIDIQDLSLLHDVEHIQLKVDADECKRRIEADASRPEKLKRSMYNYVDEWHRLNR